MAIRLILKARQGLVQRKQQVTRGGKTFQTTVWVRPGDKQKQQEQSAEPKPEKEQPKKKEVVKLKTLEDLEDAGLHEEFSKRFSAAVKQSDEYHHAKGNGYSSEEAFEYVIDNDRVNDGITDQVFDKMNADLKAGKLKTKLKG